MKEKEFLQFNVIVRLREKIGIDIDDVVAEFMKCYLSFHNNKYGTSFCLEDVTNYHLWKCGVHNSKESSINFIGEFQHSASFDEITLVDGAKEGVSFVSEKYYPYFITSRPRELEKQTKKFLQKNFPNLKYGLFFSGEIYGGKTKSEICESLGVKRMVEDNFDYTADCAKKGIVSYCLEKPWNKNCKGEHNLIKVENWWELKELL